MTAGPRVIAALEGKHSRNLPSGDEKVNFADKYNESTDYRYTYPAGQLMRYMADNGVAYGMLTCARRSFFMRRRGDGTVEITNAFDVSAPGYLRLLCYFCSAAVAEAPCEWPAELPNLPQRMLDNQKCKCLVAEVRSCAG